MLACTAAPVHTTVPVYTTASACSAGLVYTTAPACTGHVEGACRWGSAADSKTQRQGSVDNRMR
eukprot:5731844-Pyramimonas_sp.AAC.1